MRSARLWIEFLGAVARQLACERQHMSPPSLIIRLAIPRVPHVGCVLRRQHLALKAPREIDLHEQAAWLHSRSSFQNLMPRRRCDDATRGGSSVVLTDMRIPTFNWHRFDLRRE